MALNTVEHHNQHLKPNKHALSLMCDGCIFIKKTLLRIGVSSIYRLILQLVIPIVFLISYCIPNLNIFPSFMVILVNKYDNDEAHIEEIIDASKAPVLASNNKAYIIKNLDTI